MANITIRNTSKRTGANDGQRTRVEGEIAIVGRQNTYPAGSFNLRKVEQIYFPSSYTARRAMIGSASGAVQPAGLKQPALGNNVVLIPIVTGTTGTRAVVGIGAIGSAMPTGTVISSFVALGY